MHNLKDIRKNLEFYKKKISERNASIKFSTLMQLDEENRNLIQRKEKKNKKKNYYLNQKNHQILKFQKS